jgi:hypothetical protein
VWSLVLALGVTAVFAGALIVSSSFSEEARLMPRLVSVGGLLFGLLLVFQELRSRRQRSEAGPGWTRDATVAVGSFAAMAVFLVLVAVGGYLGAVLIFVPIVLLYVARARPRTAVLYTVILSLVLLALPSLLPVDLPTGMLQ